MSSFPSPLPRVRFAPSPTGYLHVGGARTALFNWLFARHFGGAFILRIEDTDLERSTAEMVEGILQGMRWLGLDWDEGPYFQTQRIELYRENATKLVTSGHAYYCFCAKEELEQRRAAAAAQGRPPRYEGICRKIAREEAVRRRAAGEAAAVRFAVPESGNTSFDDAVFGRVEFANTELEDFVLLRSDGGPTYHLSVVTDDVDMRITHIIRGADHIPNTPKQVLLYEALGARLPVFAHVPLILGPDKTRLSKRHGATSVIAYREEGIVPEAFRNFLALLGWTPPEASSEPEATEILGDQQLIHLFDLNGISRSNAVFDRPKLDWFNTEYIRAYPAEKLLPLIQEAAKLGDFSEIIPISALTGESVERTLETFIKYLPAGPPQFPTDQYTDQPERFLAAEIVREKAMASTTQEVPHAIAVLVEAFEETDKLIRIRATIYVEREGQKGILIGSKGSSLKKIGTEARKELESILGTKIFLELFVKVLKDWRDNPQLVHQMDWRWQLDHLSGE